MAVVKFRIRRDTAGNWTTNNPTLALGEPGLETDTRKVKWGDGVTAWTGLAYGVAVTAWADITGKPTFGTMSTQDASAVTITGGSAIGLATVRIANSAAGDGIGGYRVSQTDSVAAVTHTSLFYTEVFSSGLGRTLFYAASPTNGATRGQFDIVTENGGAFMFRLGPASTGTENALDVHDIAGASKVRLHTNGNSYFNGGNLGVGTTGPDYKLDVEGSFGFTPGASVTPASNGDVVFELTNNTTLTVKAKGSDGVVRSVALTLA